MYTTVWIDCFLGISNPETDWLDAELDRQRLGLTDIILCDVLHGVRDEAEATKIEASVAEACGAGNRRHRSAKEAARNDRTLHSRGHTARKTIDCLIATFCIRKRHSLLHRDRNVDPMLRHLWASQSFTSDGPLGGGMSAVIGNQNGISSSSSFRRVPARPRAAGRGGTGIPGIGEIGAPLSSAFAISRSS
jgi:predicted nucleic acid-binding protein